MMPQMIRQALRIRMESRKMSKTEKEKRVDLLAFDLSASATPYAITYEYAKVRVLTMPEELVLALLCDTSLQDSGYEDIPLFELTRELRIDDGFVHNALDNLMSEDMIEMYGSEGEEITSDRLEEALVGDFDVNDNASRFYKYKRFVGKPNLKEENLYFCPFYDRFVDKEEIKSALKTDHDQYHGDDDGYDDDDFYEQSAASQKTEQNDSQVSSSRLKLSWQCSASQASGAGAAAGAGAGAMRAGGGRSGTGRSGTGRSGGRADSAVFEQTDPVPPSAVASDDLLRHMAVARVNDGRLFPEDCSLTENGVEFKPLDEEAGTVTSEIKIMIEPGSGNLSLFSSEGMVDSFLNRCDDRLKLNYLISPLLSRIATMHRKACQGAMEALSEHKTDLFSGLKKALTRRGRENEQEHEVIASGQFMPSMPDGAEHKISFMATDLYYRAADGSCLRRDNPDLSCWRFMDNDEPAVVICDRSMVERMLGMTADDETYVGCCNQDVVTMFMHEILDKRERHRRPTMVIVLDQDNADSLHDMTDYATGEISAASGEINAAAREFARRISAVNPWKHTGFMMRSRPELAREYEVNAKAVSDSKDQKKVRECWQRIINDSFSFMAMVNLRSGESLLLRPEHVDCHFAGQTFELDRASVWDIKAPDLLQMRPFAACSDEELVMMSRMAGQISVHNHVGPFTVNRLESLIDRGIVKIDSVPDSFFKGLHSVSSSDELDRLNKTVYSSYGRKKLSLKSFDTGIRFEVMRRSLGYVSSRNSGRNRKLFNIAALSGQGSKLNFDVYEFSRLIKLREFADGFDSNRPQSLIGQKDLWPDLLDPDNLQLEMMELFEEKDFDSVEQYFEPLSRVRREIFKIFEPVNRKASYAVLDTNYVLDHATDLHRLFHDRTVLIPDTVMSELDGIKHSRNKAQSVKDKVSRSLNSLEMIRDRMKIITASEPLINMVRSVNTQTNQDDRILAAALRYMFNNTVFYSSDRQCNIKAGQLGLQTKS